MKRVYSSMMVGSGALQGAGEIDGLLASVEPSSGSSYYYLYDVNGNVGALSDDFPD